MIHWYQDFSCTWQNGARWRILLGRYVSSLRFSTKSTFLSSMKVSKLFNLGNGVKSWNPINYSSILNLRINEEIMATRNNIEGNLKEMQLREIIPTLSLFLFFLLFAHACVCVSVFLCLSLPACIICMPPLHMCVCIYVYLCLFLPAFLSYSSHVCLSLPLSPFSVCIHVKYKSFSWFRGISKVWL